MKILPPVVFLVLLPMASQNPVRSPQALLELLGEDLAALLSSREGDPASLPQDAFSRLLSGQRGLLRGAPSPSSATFPEGGWLHVLRDLLNSQKKFRGRGKKTTGQQGCFGIKLGPDRDPQRPRVLTVSCL